MNTNTAAAPPASAPFMPVIRKCRRNSAAMKAASAPTKCSTSMMWPLPAIAPRVANTTESTVADSIRTSTAMPIVTMVRAIETRRSTQVRWSSTVAVGTSGASMARICTKSGGLSSSMVMTIRRGTGSSSMFEAGAEPGLEQPRRRLAVDDVRLAHAGKAAGDARGGLQRRVHVEPVGGLDLDGRLARDLAFPDGGRIADQGDRSERQAGEEGHDGDDEDQRAAGDVVRGHDRRRLALQARHGLDGHGGRRRRGLRLGPVSHGFPAFPRRGSCAARRPGPSGRDRGWR